MPARSPTRSTCRCARCARSRSACAPRASCCCRRATDGSEALQLGRPAERIGVYELLDRAARRARARGRRRAPRRARRRRAGRARALARAAGCASAHARGPARERLPPAGRVDRPTDRSVGSPRRCASISITTPPRPSRDEVADAMLRALRDVWGNPSSVHAEGACGARGRRARARAVAALLGVEPATSVFTAGASEANNTVLARIAGCAGGAGRHVVSSNVEHPSVEAPLAALEAQRLARDARAGRPRGPARSRSASPRRSSRTPRSCRCSRPTTRPACVQPIARDRGARARARRAAARGRHAGGRQAAARPAPARRGLCLALGAQVRRARRASAAWSRAARSRFEPFAARRRTGARPPRRHRERARHRGSRRSRASSRAASCRSAQAALATLRDRLWDGHRGEGAGRAPQRQRRRTCCRTR